MALLSSAKARLWSNMITSLSASFISEQVKGSKLATWELRSKSSCVDFRLLVKNLLWHRRQSAMNFNNLSNDENRWTRAMKLDWFVLGCTSTTKVLDSRFTSGSLPDSSVLCWRRLAHSEGGFKIKNWPLYPTVISDERICRSSS